MESRQSIAIPVDRIEVGFRLRAVDQAKVDNIKASIAETGLQSPITVRAKPGEDNRWLLVAGAHRLEAAFQTGMYRIDAIISTADDVDAELWEIDENLCRADLTPADRAIFTHRRKDLYLQKHPETAHGGNRKSSRQVGDLNEAQPKRFTAATAEATGQSERKVQRDVERGESISSVALQRLRGTRLDTGATLDKIKHLPHDVQEKWVDAALDDEKRIQSEAKDIRGHKQKANHEGRLRHMALVAEAGTRFAGKVGKHYPVIYADPPWRFEVRSETTGREKSAENHYPTMSTPEISGLLAEAGIYPARDAVCFLWATNPMLPDALGVLQAWGFTYVHHWIWDKVVAGTGYWGRDRHEILLIGRRGTPAVPLPGTQPETVHAEKKTAHSAKPVWYAEQIERLYPDIPKIELFCRAPREGWDVWGFEAVDAEGGGNRSSESISGGEGLSATPREGATEADRPFDQLQDSVPDINGKPVKAGDIVASTLPDGARYEVRRVYKNGNISISNEDSHQVVLKVGQFEAAEQRPSAATQAPLEDATEADDALYQRVVELHDAMDDKERADGPLMRATRIADELGIEWELAIALCKRVDEDDAETDLPFGPQRDQLAREFGIVPSSPLPSAPGPTAPVEFTVGGMREKNHARFSVSLNEDKTFSISASYEISGFCGGASPRTGNIATFADALRLGLRELRKRLDSVVMDASSVCTSSHKAAARGGIRWIDSKIVEWGLETPQAAEPDEPPPDDPNLLDRARAIASTADGATAALFQEHLGVSWAKAVELLDAIEAENLYPLAVDLVRKTGNSSPSLLQRRFAISWEKATELIEQMTVEKVLPLRSAVKATRAGRKAVAG